MQCERGFLQLNGFFIDPIHSCFVFRFQCELSAVPHRLHYFFSAIDEPSHCGEVSCLQHIFIDMMAVACCSTVGAACQA